MTIYAGIRHGRQELDSFQSLPNCVIRVITAEAPETLQTEKLEINTTSDQINAKLDCLSYGLELTQNLIGADC